MVNFIGFFFFFIIFLILQDVSDGLFPLGDDLSDDEEVEKIDMKKSVQKLLDQEDKFKRKNEKKKEEYRRLAKERRKQEREEEQKAILNKSWH